MKFFNKKLIFIFLILIAAVSIYVVLTNDVLFKEALALRIDSKNIELKNKQAPYVDKNNEVMIPLRTVAEQLGGDIEWNKSLKQAIVKKGNSTIKFGSSSEFAFVNERPIKINKTRIVKRHMYVSASVLEQTLNIEVEHSLMYKTVTIYTPNTHISIKQFEQLRKIPSKVGGLDNKTYSYEDSNVWCFLPIEQSSNKELATVDGKYQDMIKYINTAVLGATSQYTLDYNKMNEYKNKLIKVYSDPDTRIVQRGEVITTEQFVQKLVNEYANKKAVTKANFYTHPGLIYFNASKQIAVRGIMEYEILESDNGWWFNSKYKHKIGQKYERDIEILLYTPIKGNDKKVSEINLLSQPREVER